MNHELAEQQAMDEYNKYNANRIAETKNHLSDFDQAVKKIESGKLKKEDEEKK